MITLTFILTIYFFVVIAVALAEKKSSSSKIYTKKKGREATFQDELDFYQEWDEIYAPPADVYDVEGERAHYYRRDMAWKERKEAIENDPLWQQHHQQYMEAHKDEIEQKKLEADAVYTQRAKASSERMFRERWKKDFGEEYKGSLFSE